MLAVVKTSGALPMNRNDMRTLAHPAAPANVLSLDNQSSFDSSRINQLCRAALSEIRLRVKALADFDIEACNSCQPHGVRHLDHPGPHLNQRFTWSILALVRIWYQSSMRGAGTTPTTLKLNCWMVSCVLP